MTDKEKLEKAIEFIKMIENLDIPARSISEIIRDVHIFCEECGEECEIDYAGKNDMYINAKELDEIRDKAWHLLADLT